MQVYLVTVMTHVIALEAGQSNQGHLSLVQLITNIGIYFQKYTLSFYHLSCLCHPACVFPPLLEDREIKANIPHPSKQCTTGRGLLSVNVLLAMLITVTVLFSSN